MEPRWQSDMYGSRNPVAMMLGTRGWGLFVAAPWVQVDMRDGKRGALLPWRPTPTQNVPQNERNQQQALGKGQPPIDEIVPGFADIFVFDARDPRRALKDYATITGPAVMPPRWALGYMQSHRTLEDDAQMLGIVDSFRAKKIPLDAVIYLGTGFAPRGWNTRQPSFDFHRDVFKRDPAAVIKDMHDRNVKVVVHMVPWDRDKLPTLHGSIPARPGETLDPSHIQSYWEQHVPLVKTGIDAFWPDEGDWFNLHERIKRHQLYYEGHLSTEPNERPWSLQRNGYPGIAQWGGWVWSGDTDSAWKTLEAQIAVGLNYSLSIGPYWGSDIGGFYPNRELTGELYARWVQFASFCASFRAHGRVWWTRLPWGWGGSDVGPKEYGNNNAPIPPDDPRNILRVGTEQPGDRAGGEEVHRAALSAHALHLHAGAGGARPRVASDALAVAALPRRRARPRHRRPVPVGTRPDDRSGLHCRRLITRRLPPARRLVRLVDQRPRHRRSVGRESRRPRDHADLRPRRRHHPCRSDPSVRGRGRDRADNRPRVWRRQRRVRALRRRREEPGVRERAAASGRGSRGTTRRDA